MEHRLWDPIPRISASVHGGGGRKFVLLPSSQVMLMVLVPRRQGRGGLLKRKIEEKAAGGLTKPPLCTWHPARPAAAEDATALAAVTCRSRDRARHSHCHFGWFPGEDLWFLLGDVQGTESVFPPLQYQKARQLQLQTVPESIRWRRS